MPGLENWMKKRQGGELNNREPSEPSEPSPPVHNSEADERPPRENKLSEPIESNPLWEVLVETVEKGVLFPNRLAYARQKLVNNNSKLTPEELSDRAGFPLGVSMVILHHLREE